MGNSAIPKSYLGLLCLGKNDFDAIDGQRKDAFFARASYCKKVRSNKRRCTFQEGLRIARLHSIGSNLNHETSLQE